METKKNYDQQVKEWWDNNFSNKSLSLNLFFKVLEEKKVIIIPQKFHEPACQIFKVIEGDIVLVRMKGSRYYVFYPRHEEFLELRFPFDEDYVEEIIKYPVDKL